MMRDIGAVLLLVGFMALVAWLIADTSRAEDPLPLRCTCSCDGDMAVLHVEPERALE